MFVCGLYFCIVVCRRITELLLQVTEMQAAVASSRASEQAMKTQMDQMAADVADTIATIGASANGRLSMLSILYNRFVVIITITTALLLLVQRSWMRYVLLSIIRTSICNEISMLSGS